MNNNKTSKIIKQLAGNLLFLGGQKPEIEDLNNALFNWSGTNDDLRDFGGDFYWFSTTIEGYIRARANAFITNRNKYFKNSKGKVGGLWSEAVKLAQKELESYPENVFIIYNPFEGEAYSLGYIHKSNEIEELYNGLNDKIKLDFNKIEIAAE